MSKKPPLQNQGFKWWEHVTIESEQAAKMAEFTKGYPFAFQVLGYLTWNHAGDYEAVIDEYNNRYHITYTLCSGLNSLQFYVTEIR